MVPSDWDSAPRCVCGSNFISDLIGESPIFPGAESRNVQLRFKPRSFILCNYYATMEVSSSDEELTHQPVVKWLSNPRQPIETPAVPRSEETTKTMMQGLGTESALLRQRSCDARACRIYACTGFHQTVHSTSSSNLYDTHTSCLPVWHTHVSNIVWHTHVLFIFVTHTRLVDVCDTHMSRMMCNIRTSRLHVWHTHVSNNVWQYKHVPFICVTHTRLHVWHTHVSNNVWQYTHVSFICVTHTRLVYMCDTYMSRIMCDTHTSRLYVLRIHVSNIVWHAHVCLHVWHTHVMFARVRHTWCLVQCGTHVCLIDMCETCTSRILCDTHSYFYMCDTHWSCIMCDLHMLRYHVWHTHVLYNVWHPHVSFTYVTHTCLVSKCDIYTSSTRVTHTRLEYCVTYICLV